MRQLSAVEGSHAVSAAQQETVSLAQLLETQQQAHKRELDSAAAVRAAEEEKEQARREEVARRLTDLQREHKKGGEREAERIAHMEAEMSRQREEATRQLAETRAAASEAVINSARLQVEAAHNMAVSVATAAAKEAVSAAMMGVSQPPPTSSSSHPSPNPPTITSKASSYTTIDFEDSVQPDSLVEENSSLLVPATSSSDRTLTPVLTAVESEEGEEEEERERGQGEKEEHTDIPEEVDTQAAITQEVSSTVSHCHLKQASIHTCTVEPLIQTPCDHEGRQWPGVLISGCPDSTVIHIIMCSLFFQSSFRELLPSESHRRQHHLSLSDSDSHLSSPTHSLPVTPSSLPGDHFPSFTYGL